MARRTGGSRGGEVAYWESNNLDEHVALIARQVQRGLDDPETRRLAVKLVSGRADGERDGKPTVTAWGREYWMPRVDVCVQGNAECEVTVLWNFVVMNVRYVLDPDGYDLFATLKHTLEVGGGDCDDMVIALATLHRALGFANVRARVVSTNAQAWEHVYLMVGLPKTSPSRFIALDPTVKGAKPGWEYPSSTNKVDYKL
jgi:hypothetical protein